MVLILFWTGLFTLEVNNNVYILFLEAEMKTLNHSYGFSIAKMVTYQKPKLAPTPCTVIKKIWYLSQDLQKHCRYIMW